MPKTVRIDFSKGTNTKIDKAIASHGYVSLADNVDLRSGFPRPFTFPAWEQDAGSTTNRIWSYRGVWHESQNYRDYVGEYIDGKERIYYTEAGLDPKMIVEGTEVNLGLPAPLMAPVVDKASSTSPVVTVANTTGNYASGRTVSYRVAWEFEDGVQPASQRAIGTSTTNGTGFILNWTGNSKAINTLIFQGPADSEKLLVTLGGNITTYTDTGAVEATGTLASDYDDAAPYQYVYTFERNVNGVVDESGPSELSKSINSATGRKITFDYLNDGAPLVAIGASVSTVGVTGSPISITAAVSGAQYQQVKFTTATPHGFATGDIGRFAGFTQPPNPTYTISSAVETKPLNIRFTTSTNHTLVAGQQVLFTGFDDPLWNNLTFTITGVSSNAFYVNGYVGAPVGALGSVQSAEPAQTTAFSGDYEVIADSTNANVFYVNGITAPTSLGTVTTLKTTINFATAHGLLDGDAVYYNGTDGTYTIKAMYRVQKVSDTSIYIRMYSSGTPTITSITKVGNYIKYRNLYRTGGVSGYSLVEQIPVYQTTYTDTKAVSALGNGPTSYYNENGQTVIFKEPPKGATCIRNHYGMKFIIDGYKVRWSPIGKPNAFPEQFFIEFGYQPVAIEPYNQSLVVLCQDAIYRIDGNDPTALSLTRTQGENGCIAKNSVQTTHAGLVYLAKRGLMLFNGMQSQCITDERLPNEFLIAPSSYDIWGANKWWMLPTRFTYNYAALTNEDGIGLIDTGSVLLNRTVPIDGINNAVRSFYWDGRYFMFWNDATNYSAHTGFVIDLQVQGFPISTLGMQILDAHVDEFGDCHVLLDNSGSRAVDEANKLAYIQAQVVPSGVVSFTANPGRTIQKFAGSREEMPYLIRTGQNSLGGEFERKSFLHFEAHSVPSSASSMYVRLFLDGRYSCETLLTPSETPNKIRKMNIPTKSRNGYATDLELTGTMRIRSIEFTFMVRGES